MQDVPVDTIRVDDWATARDIACRIGGPNPTFPPTACYSQAHYEAIGGALDKLDRYQTLSSLTSITAGQPFVLPLGRAAAGGILRAHRQERYAAHTDCTRAR